MKSRCVSLNPDKFCDICGLYVWRLKDRVYKVLHLCSSCRIMILYYMDLNLRFFKYKYKEILEDEN